MRSPRFFCIILVLISCGSPQTRRAVRVGTQSGVGGTAISPPNAPPVLSASATKEPPLVKFTDTYTSVATNTQTATASDTSTTSATSTMTSTDSATNPASDTSTAVSTQIILDDGNVTFDPSSSPLMLWPATWAATMPTNAAFQVGIGLTTDTNADVVAWQSLNSRTNFRISPIVPGLEPTQKYFGKIRVIGANGSPGIPLVADGFFAYGALGVPAFAEVSGSITANVNGQQGLLLRVVPYDIILLDDHGTAVIAAEISHGTIDARIGLLKYKQNELDATFGSGGVFYPSDGAQAIGTTAPEDNINLGVLRDGSFVLTSSDNKNIKLWRVDPDGSGLMENHSYADADSAVNAIRVWDMKVSSDGSVLLCGSRTSSATKAVVWRIAQDQSGKYQNSLDLSFGPSNNGMLELDDKTQCNGLALAQDGFFAVGETIVTQAASGATPATITDSMWVRKFDSNGKIGKIGNSEYNARSASCVRRGGDFSWASAAKVFVNNDGSIYIGGRMCPPSSPASLAQMAVWKVKADGTWDTNMGPNGMWVGPPSDTLLSSVFDVVGQVDMKAVFAGFQMNFSNSDSARMTAGRILTSGALDPGFASSGIYQASFVGRSFANRIRISNGGRIHIVGETKPNGLGDSDRGIGFWGLK